MACENLLRLDARLLTCVKSGDNELAAELLDLELAATSEREPASTKARLGCLMHHAALHDNADFVHHLLRELGCDADLPDCQLETALVIAVKRGHAATAETLLGANASIDVVNARGEKLLGTAVDAVFVGKIVDRLIERARLDCSSLDELAVTLIAAGCPMFLAAFSNDRRLMRSLLDHGLHVDSGSRSALHAAVWLDDSPLAEWLLDHGANVDALDGMGETPLFYAAFKANAELVRLFLERGANPNVVAPANDTTPLFDAFAGSTCYLAAGDRVDECVQLLLRYGAVPRNSGLKSRRTIFDYALSTNSRARIDAVIGQLAMLGKIGAVDDAKSALTVRDEDHLEQVAALEDYYDECEMLLGRLVYRELRMIDAMSASDGKLRRLVRDECFVERVRDVDGRWGRVYPSYFGPLMERIAEAIEAVKLEDEAIPVLCELLGGGYDLCYNFAREIVAYLSESDLERLGRLRN